MLKVAITGPDGLVGSRIIELLSSEFEFVPITQQQVDITQKQAVENVLSSLKFDIFLHLAAYTNVDGAERNKELVHKVNVDGTRHVFDAVKSMGKKFIYISTDFVFDGHHPPYDESKKPDPISYYGETKYEGEKIVGKEAMIVRLAYPYRAHFEVKKDFVRTLVDLLEQGRTLTMVNDSLMTPTFIDDLANALKHLLNNFEPSIFHLVGADSMSPYEAAQTIADVYGFDKKLVEATTYDEYFKDKAARPHYSQIISKKNTFYPMKTFREGLEVIKNQ